MANSVRQLLHNKRVLVCVGAGGVGKTTVSAALGVAAAQQGLRTLVLTVDPARRLANALGLAAFDEHVQTISVEDFAADGAHVAAPLDVAMLDVKSTFDRAVLRLAPTPEKAQAILDNRFYQQGSTVLAGSQEYMAMARLYEVVTETSYDLVVLDTPPSAHALDFLEAPQRMIDLFGSGAFRMLLRSLRRQREGAGMFRKGGLVMRGLGRFTSAESFTALLEFFSLLSETFDGFIQTAQDVTALLRSERTAFLVVSACDETSTTEGLYLSDRLLQEEMTVGAWVLNRVQSFSEAALDAPDQVAAELRHAIAAETPGRAETAAPSQQDAETLQAIQTVAAAMARLARSDHGHLDTLRARLAKRPHAPEVVPVPRAREEPARLSELSALAQILAHEPVRP